MWKSKSSTQTLCYQALIRLERLRTVSRWSALSERHLQDVAHGLILGCCKHFGDDCEVQMEEPSEDESVRFTIVHSQCLATA